MSFNWKDFWDNLSGSADLVHKEIAIVPEANQLSVQFIIATNVANISANQTVSFTPDFNGKDTNYVFRFITADQYNNVRTTAVTAVNFNVTPEPFLFEIYYLIFAIYYLKKRK